VVNVDIGCSSKYSEGGEVNGGSNGAAGGESNEGPEVFVTLNSTLNREFFVSSSNIQD